ncbi:MAG: T9SS type A sorting domain-containing protein [Bacteroidia bacterium]
MKNNYNLKMRLGLFLSCLMVSFSAFSQTVNSYGFSVSTGASLDPMTGSVQLIGTGVDDNPSAVQSIGFNFVYEGTTYTQYSLTPDGFLKLGATAAVAQYSNSMTSTTNIPKISAMWDDGATGTSGQVHTVLNGVPGSQIRIIDWNVTNPRNTSGIANTDYQIWLYEGTNVIEFRYGASTSTGTPSSSATIGLTGATATNFNSVTSSLGGGTNNTATANNANSVWPGNGTMYTFTPPVPCTGSPASGIASGPSSVCSGLSFTLSLAGYTTGVSGITFQWQSSPDGITYTDIAGAVSPSLTTSQTANTFYQCVVTCTASGLSATSNSLDVTMVAPSYATIPFLETFEASWINGCATKDIPDNNWNNSLVTGNNSWRRQDEGATASWSFLPTGIVTPSGSTGAADYHSYGSSSGSGALNLFIDLSTASPVSLNFDYNNISGTDSMAVYLSTDAGATFNRIATYHLSPSWTHELINMGVIGSATSVLRFRGFTDYGNDDIGIDNVNVDLTPACIAPTAPGITGITGTDATFTWTPGATETHWDVYYGPNPLTAPTGSTIPTDSSTTNSFTATGLTPLTSYQYYVRADCGSGSVSSWTGPYTFNTSCGGASCNYLFALKDNAGDGWNGASIDVMENGIIVQNVTLTSGAVDSIYVPLCDGIVTSLVWHRGSFPSETSYTLYNAYNATINSFSNGSTMTEDSVFAVFTTNCTPPACPQPVGLSVTGLTPTTADVSWSCPTCMGPYIIELDSTGVAPGTGTLDTVASSPFTITGLTEGTTYQIFVSQDCSASSDGVSTQNGPVAFTTPVSYDAVCGAFTLAMGVNGPFNTAVGTVQTGEPAPPALGCSTPMGWCNSTITNTLWFSFVAPASGRVSVQSPGFDTQLALWDAANCDTILHGGATLLAANDDDPTAAADGGATYSSMLKAVNCLTPGKKYFVQLDPYSSQGSTTIILTDLGPANSSFTGLTSPVCSGGAAVTLTPAQPGGVFSGAGVTGTTFNPTTAGTGTHTIIYKTSACDSTVQTVVVDSLPNAAFSSGVTASTAAFTNSSTDNLTNSWNFGDGSPANTTANPSHTYSANGTYTVHLIVSNLCGTDSVTHTVTIVGIGIQENVLGGISVFPNPTDGMVSVTISNANFSELKISVVDIQGKEVYTAYDKNISANYSKQINLENLSKGLYYIKLSTGTDVKVEKLIIQ